MNPNGPQLPAYEWGFWRRESAGFVMRWGPPGPWARQQNRAPLLRRRPSGPPRLLEKVFKKQVLAEFYLVGDTARDPDGLQNHFFKGGIFGLDNISEVFDRSRHSHGGTRTV